MCGIVGYLGERVARDALIDGLRRLEYRGYDSAGAAWFKKDNVLLKSSKKEPIESSVCFKVESKRH